jgi:polyisoprenoid-binding protein YceI
LAPHPRNKKVFAGFTATGTLDRTAFGMKFGSPGISPKVMVRIEALTQKK